MKLNLFENKWKKKRKTKFDRDWFVFSLSNHVFGRLAALSSSGEMNGDRRILVQYNGKVVQRFISRNRLRLYARRRWTECLCGQNQVFV